MSKKILISDPTLRDGNHAVRHQLSRESFVAYCRAAEAAGVPIVEVGHGNGLGASSMLVGECRLTDEEILSLSRANLVNSRSPTLIERPDMRDCLRPGVGWGLLLLRCHRAPPVISWE